MKVAVIAIITSICFPLEDIFMKSARPDCGGRGLAEQEAIQLVKVVPDFAALEVAIDMQAIAITASQFVAAKEEAAVATSEGELEIGLECEAARKAKGDHSYRGPFEGALLVACRASFESIQHYSHCCFDKQAIVVGVTIAVTYVAAIAIAAVATTDAVVEASIIATATAIAATTVEGFATVPTRPLLIFRLVRLPRFTKEPVSSPKVVQAFGVLPSVNGLFGALVALVEQVSLPSAA